MNTDILPHPPGTRVSWKSQIIAGHRHFGIVVSYASGYYKIRTEKRVIMPVHRSRVTKECE